VDKETIAEFVDTARLAAAAGDSCDPDDDAGASRAFKEAAASAAIAQAGTLALIEQSLASIAESLARIADNSDALAAWINHTGPGN
jgi:hypothetical protein